MMARYRQRGFTLLELMITVTIVAVLAVVATATYSRYKKDARRSEGVSAINDIRMKQETFFNTYSHYVATTDPSSMSFTGDLQTSDDLTGYYSWNVECPDPSNEWCQLGFEPPTHPIEGEGRYMYFQWQTVGWAPDRDAPDFVDNTDERWLTVQARGLPNDELDNCSILRYTSNNPDVLTLTEQDCGN